MAGVSHCGNVVIGDLKEMIKLSRMQQENEGAKDRNVDNMYIKQAEHMLRTKMYEAGVSYIMKALEINPESQVNIQIVAFVQTNSWLIFTCRRP